MPDRFKYIGNRAFVETLPTGRLRIWGEGTPQEIKKMTQKKPHTCCYPYVIRDRKILFIHKGNKLAAETFISPDGMCGDLLWYFSEKALALGCYLPTKDNKPRKMKVWLIRDKKVES